jgi:hypothetical protein
LRYFKTAHEAVFLCLRNDFVVCYREQSVLLYSRNSNENKACQMPQHRNRLGSNSGAAAQEFWKKAAATSKSLTQTFREFLESQEKRIKQAGVSAALRTPSPTPTIKKAPAPAVKEDPAPIISSEFKIHTAADDLLDFLRKYIVSISPLTFPSIIAEIKPPANPDEGNSAASSPQTIPTTAEVETTANPDEGNSAASDFRESIRDEKIYCFAALREKLTAAKEFINANPSIRGEKSSALKKTHQLTNPNTYQRNQNRRHFLKMVKL